MRILLGHTYYQQAGGEDRVFEAEAALLERNGHTVLRYSLHNEALEGLSRAELVKVSHWNKESYRDITKLVQDFQPDVVHFHNTFPLMSPSVYHACQKAGVPVVQTLHNYRLLCPAATLFRAGQICEACLRMPVKLPAVRHACYRDDHKASAVVTSVLAFHHFKGSWQRGVDRYIAISDFVRRKFIEAGMPPEAIVTKPNAVNDVAVGPGGGGALFVGRLVPEKGVPSMLAAWKTLEHEIPLTVTGDGPLAEQVERAAADHTGINYLGQVSKQKVEALMKAADFVVFPSVWYEPFGLVIAEAFAAGTPVVAAKTESVAAMVEEGVSGRFFEPGQPESLIHTVRALLNNPAQFETMRPGARAAFEAHYSEEASYARLIHIYEGVQKASNKAG